MSEQLEERLDLVNPARRQTPSQLFSDSRPGSSRVGGRGFAFDDHREANLDHLDTEFAREIASAIRRIVAETGATRVILCASSRMLGEMRATNLGHDGIAIDELRRDLTKLTPPQIRALLVEHELLPAPPPRPGLARQA